MFSIAIGEAHCACGKTWSRDPVLEVPCPVCGAPVGKPCQRKRPSGPINRHYPSEAAPQPSHTEMVHLLIGADIPMPPHAAVAALACLFPTRDEQANLQRGTELAYEQIALGGHRSVAVYYDPATVAPGLLAGCLIACARHRVTPLLFIVDGQSYRSLM